MKRLFICLFVVFALLFGPVAHAAGVSCLESSCKLADSSSKKKDDGTLTGASHHCCQHIADHAQNAVFGSPSEIPSDFIPAKPSTLVSITVGPLLEPPSLA